MNQDEEISTQPAEFQQVKRLQHAKPAAAALLIVTVIGALIGYFSQDQWIWVLDTNAPDSIEVTAPILTIDDSTESLYRITPDNGSTITYRVEESLAGKSGFATGETTAVAGDIALNSGNPSASRISTIVINLEVLKSDSTLRDKRLRHDYLESGHYPIATFAPTAIEGLPESKAAQTVSDLSITGDLTVKDQTAPVTFTGTAELDDGKLRANVSASVLMSAFGVGPINLSGLVHTSDEVELSFELVADRVDASTDTPADVTAIDPVAAATADGSFDQEIKPILEASCVSCHVSGGPGHSTIAIDTAGDAASIADGIAMVVNSGYMPPWPASDLGLAMNHDYSLSEDEIETILAWADEGGGIDLPADTELTPVADPYPALEVDLDLAPVEPYVGSLDLKDDYRCAIVDLPDPEGDGTWIKGIQFDADQDEVVHHAIIASVVSDSRQAVENLVAADPGAGYACFATVTGMPGVNGANIGGWAPGTQPQILPDGYAIFVPPGGFLVTQIHYHFDHESPADQSRVKLDTIPTEEINELVDENREILTVTAAVYRTPAEGPCAPQEEGRLCDREAVLQEIGAKYGPILAQLPDMLINQCGGTLTDYAVLDGSKFRSSCDVSSRHNGTIYQLVPHMHEFGSSYRMTLNPDTPEERILIDIPTWGFEWQLNYLPIEDVYLDQDDVIRIECEWDRSLQAMPEPRYITWSDGSADEMCFSTITLLPDRK